MVVFSIPMPLENSCSSREPRILSYMVMELEHRLFQRLISLPTSDVTGLLPVANGGTGVNSYTAGDMLYYVSGTALTKLAIGGANTCLISNASAPTWGNCALGTNYWQ